MKAENEAPAYWPLVRFQDHDFDGDPAASVIMLTDADMVALRVALRVLCRIYPGGDRLGPVLESLRDKVETVLDLEFAEGRFAPGAEGGAHS